MNVDTDVIYLVVECLAKAKASLGQKEVLDEIPFEHRRVTGALYSLYACGFLERHLATANASVVTDGDYLFAVTKGITAYQIVKVGELGLDMNALAGLVEISEKQKQAAMALTLQTEKLVQLDEEARTKRTESSARTAKIKPLPRDSVVDTLERLAKASELSINEINNAKGNEDVLRALVDAKEQALKALNQYQSQLQTGGADPLGF